MSDNARDRALVENELLVWMLGLPRSTQPAAALERAVQLLAEASGATAAHLELIAGDAPGPGIAAGHDVTGADAGDVICRGVIARAIVERAVIETPSARSDPRFRELGSVRKNEIEAVLCAPILVGEVIGAVCVQRRLRGDPFTEVERRLLDDFVQQLALVVNRIVATTPVTMRDEIKKLQTALVRDALVRCGGNVARAARELDVARSFIYSVLPKARGARRAGRRA